MKLLMSLMALSAFCHTQRIDAGDHAPKSSDAQTKTVSPVSKKKRIEIADLPEEIILEFFKKLPEEGSLNLAQTCEKNRVLHTESVNMVFANGKTRLFRDLNADDLLKIERFIEPLGFLNRSFNLHENGAWLRDGGILKILSNYMNSKSHLTEKYERLSTLYRNESAKNLIIDSLLSEMSKIKLENSSSEGRLVSLNDLHSKIISLGLTVFRRNSPTKIFDLVV